MHKVLIVSPLYFFPENRDGISKINYNILKENEFYEADFLCVETIKQISSDISHTKVQSLSLNLDIRPPNFLKKIQKLIFSRQPQIVIDANLTKKLALKINQIESKYDAILITTLAVARTIDNLSSAAQKKTTLSSIDSLSFFFKRRYKVQSNFIKKFLFWVEFKKAALFEKVIFNKYNKISFVSSIDKEYVDNKLHTKNKTLAIPNGVNLDIFKSLPNVNSTPYQLIFTGNLSYAPNSEACRFLVNQLMPVLIKQSSKYKLILVGSNPPEFLKKLMHPNIQITGYVEDLNLLLNESSIYISPLFSGAGIKNKILEAMAAEINIIGSSISFDGIEYLSPNSTIVKSSDPNEWAKQIIGFNKNLNQDHKEFSSIHLSWRNTTQNYFHKIFKET